MTHDPAQTQPDPTQPADGGNFAPSRLEMALCLTLISVCPVCGEEHAIVLPATETLDRLGWMNYRVACAGPFTPPADTTATPDATPADQRLAYRAPTHAYVTRVLHSTVQRAIAQDMPRRLWWPHVKHDADR